MGDGRTYAGEYRDKDVARAGDLLIALTDITQQGDVLGSPLMVPSSVGEFCLYTLDAGKLHLNERIDSLFAYHGLRSHDFRAFAAAYATGTTVRRIHPTDVLAYEFSLPPLGEQRRIARVLGALDERIEANRRAVAALEEMARTLFRHWFVDFGPVRAKAAGLPSVLPPGLDALFPASLEASYAYYAMQSLRTTFERYETGGTVFGSIGKREFAALPLLLAPNDAIAQFEALCAPIDNRIKAAEGETRTLTALRDTLLPRLLSGEVRAP